MCCPDKNISPKNTVSPDQKELQTSKKDKYVSILHIEALLDNLKGNKQLPEEYKSIISPFLMAGFSKVSDFHVFLDLSTYKPEFSSILSGKILKKNNPQKQYEVLSSAEK